MSLHPRLILVLVLVAVSPVTDAQSRPADPPPRLLVVEYGAGAPGFHASAARFAAARGATLATVADTTHPEALTAAARAHDATALALFVAPEVLDINLNRRVLAAVCAIDDDPFPDATYGFFTGATPDDVSRMVDASLHATRLGVPPIAVSYGIAEVDKLIVYPTQTVGGGFTERHVYLPTKERYASVRRDIPAALAEARGAGFVQFSGNGDPMRVWLFSGQRNMKHELHWPFAPAKIQRDFASADMPGMGPADLAAFPIGGAVVAFSTCHSGVPVHAMVADDIVSTFGQVPGHRVAFYDMTRSESLCLALLARAPAALIAPIGPNHGYQGLVEFWRGTHEGLSLGEILRRNQIDVALAYAATGIPLVRQTAGQPETRPAVPGSIMRENTLNRILFGDPTLNIFASRSDKLPALRVGQPSFEPAGVTPKPGDTPSSRHQFTVSVKPVDLTTPEYWDSYHGSPRHDHLPDMGERMLGSFPLPPTPTGSSATDPAVAVASIGVSGKLAADVKLTHGEWALEHRPHQPSLIWFCLNAPAGATFSARTLWRAETDLTLTVTLAFPDGPPAVPHGDITLP